MSVESQPIERFRDATILGENFEPIVIKVPTAEFYSEEISKLALSAVDSLGAYDVHFAGEEGITIKSIKFKHQNAINRLEVILEPGARLVQIQTQSPLPPKYIGKELNLPHEFMYYVPLTDELKTFRLEDLTEEALRDRERMANNVAYEERFTSLNYTQEARHRLFGLILKAADS